VLGEYFYEQFQQYQLSKSLAAWVSIGFSFSQLPSFRVRFVIPGRVDLHFGFDLGDHQDRLFVLILLILVILKIYLVRGFHLGRIHHHRLVVLHVLHQRLVAHVLGLHSLALVRPLVLLEGEGVGKPLPALLAGVVHLAVTRGLVAPQQEGLGEGSAAVRAGVRPVARVRVLVRPEVMLELEGG